MKARKSRPVPEYGNCIECGQGRDTRFFNDVGVCGMCQLVVMKWPENPLLPLPTYL